MKADYPGLYTSVRENVDSCVSQTVLVARRPSLIARHFFVSILLSTFIFCMEKTSILKQGYSRTKWLTWRCFLRRIVSQKVEILLRVMFIEDNVAKAMRLRDIERDIPRCLPKPLACPWVFLGEEDFQSNTSKEGNGVAGARSTK